MFFLLSPSALTPGKDILSWMDHSAHRQHTGDDDLCEAPEGCLAGRMEGTEVTGGSGPRVRSRGSREEEKYEAGTVG